MALRRSHPRSVFIESAGLMWAIYYLYRQNWPAALGAYVIFRLIAYFAVKDVSPEKMATTTIGRIGLLHLEPFNLALQALGLGMFVYGLWLNSALAMLAGGSLILVGHFVGWNKVNPAYD